MFHTMNFRHFAISTADVLDISLLKYEQCLFIKNSLLTNISTLIFIFITSSFTKNKAKSPSRFYDKLYKIAIELLKMLRVLP